jgi:DNA-binding transcriptional regulator YiaG
MSIFDDLHASLEQAVEIKNGKLNHSKVTRYEVADVKAIRAELKVTQREFAGVLGTSVDTVKSWESKRRNPTGLTAKVLATIEENPSYYQVLATH